MILFYLCILSLFFQCNSSCTYQNESKSENEVLEPSYRSIAYFVNWAIYGRNYVPQNLPVKDLTHIFYAFANIDKTGKVSLDDPYADLEFRFDSDSHEQSEELNMYGCIKQLNLLKKEHRNIKILLSVGGWTYSKNFALPLSTSSGRQTFVTSALQLIQDIGFDGLDIDWEYPENNVQATDFVSLLQQLRNELNRLKQRNVNFQLTVAVPADPLKYNKLHVQSMDQYLDFWNLMGYDFAGSFSTISGHQSNVYPSQHNPESTPFNILEAVNFYTKVKGVKASRINLGMPLYGRGFANTDGLGKPFAGVGSGSWEPGAWDFKVLPLTDAVETFDQETRSSYSYDPKKRELISYDNLQVTISKADFVKSFGLGGAMWWESSSDKPGNQSLISAFVSAIGKSSLTHDQNSLEYPISKYKNLRNKFEGESFKPQVLY